MSVNRYKPEEIRRIRKVLGWTLAELHQKCQTVKFDVSESTIGNWDDGTTVPDADKLATLAGIFGVSIERFYEET